MTPNVGFFRASTLSYQVGVTENISDVRVSNVLCKTESY